MATVNPFSFIEFRALSLLWKMKTMLFIDDACQRGRMVLISLSVIFIQEREDYEFILCAYTIYQKLFTAIKLKYFEILICSGATPNTFAMLCVMNFNA